MKTAIPHWEKPLAAAGLTSYRYPSGRGLISSQQTWVMIGAKDHADAINEANRSLSQKAASMDKLQIWDGEKYVSVLTTPQPAAPLASASLNARERKAQRLLAHYATCERLARYLANEYQEHAYVFRLEKCNGKTQWIYKGELAPDGKTTFGELHEADRAALDFPEADDCRKMTKACEFFPQPDGKKISVALFKVERYTSHAAVRYCNGEISTERWEYDCGQARQAVESILGTRPPGFFVNGDPRGYALKIDNETPEGQLLIATVGLQRDLGGFGLLSPQINGDTISVRTIRARGHARRAAMCISKTCRK